MKRMPVGLASGEPLRIDEPDETTLRVVRGRVWITQEGSVDDVFLDAGSGHTFRTDGAALVSAEGGANAAATIVFDAPLEIGERTTFMAAMKRLLTWRPAPSSIASNAYEGI